LDHRGIGAGVCRRIRLIEQIDRIVSPSERQVTVGEAVQAMVLHAWGCACRALDLTPGCVASHPIDLLIREGLQAEECDEDRLGRALDRLYQAGGSEGGARLASQALQGDGRQHRVVPLDRTSISLQGESAAAAADPRAIRLTHGDS
jgi:hypothetical protein